MDVLIRGVINILIVFLYIGIVIYQREKLRSVGHRCVFLLQYLAWVFPFTDFGKDILNFKLGVVLLCPIALFIVTPKLWSLIWEKQYRGLRIFAVIIIVSAIFSEFSSFAFAGALTYLIYIGIFLIGVKASQYEGIDVLSRKIFTPIAFWVIVFASIQIFIDPTFSLYFSSRSVDVRMAYCFDNAQSAGMGCAWLFLYYFNQYYLGKRRKTSDLLLSLVFLVLIGFSGTKSAVLGAACGLILILIYAKIKVSNIVIISFGVALIAFTYPLWSQLSVVQRMTEFDDSLSIRQSFFWAGGLKMFEENWLIGVGPGCFQEYNQEHFYNIVHQDYGMMTYATQPESGYLLWLDEFGIFGVYPLLLILSLFRIRNRSVVNFSLILPWLMAFVSFANIQRLNIAWWLVAICAMTYQSNKEFKNHENFISR